GDVGELPESRQEQFLGYRSERLAETRSETECIRWIEHLQDGHRWRVTVRAGVERGRLVVSRKRDDPAQSNCDSAGELLLSRSDEDRERKILADSDDEHHTAQEARWRQHERRRSVRRSIQHTQVPDQGW